MRGAGLPLNPLTGQPAIGPPAWIVPCGFGRPSREEGSSGHTLPLWSNSVHNIAAFARNRLATSNTGFGFPPASGVAARTTMSVQGFQANMGTNSVAATNAVSRHAFNAGLQGNGYM